MARNWTANHNVSIMVLLCFQLWDIRDGMCKQTFSGHESDINAITVSVCHAYYGSMAVYGPFYLQLCAFLAYFPECESDFFHQTHLVNASCNGFLYIKLYLCTWKRCMHVFFKNMTRLPNYYYYRRRSNKELLDKTEIRTFIVRVALVTLLGREDCLMMNHIQV